MIPEILIRRLPRTTDDSLPWEIRVVLPVPKVDGVPVERTAVARVATLDLAEGRAIDLLARLLPGVPGIPEWAEDAAEVRVRTAARYVWGITETVDYEAPRILD